MQVKCIQREGKEGIKYRVVNTFAFFRVLTDLLRELHENSEGRCTRGKPISVPTTSLLSDPILIGPVIYIRRLTLSQIKRQTHGIICLYIFIQHQHHSSTSTMRYGLLLSRVSYGPPSLSHFSLLILNSHSTT